VLPGPSWEPAPAGFSDHEKAAYDQLKMLPIGYFIEQGTRPQTIGYSLAAPLGNSRRCSRKRSEQRSDRCGDGYARRNREAAKDASITRGRRAVRGFSETRARATRVRNQPSPQG
jgi:hypothetical protein